MMFYKGQTAIRKSTREAVVIEGMDSNVGSIRMWKIRSIVSGRLSSCAEADLMPSTESLGPVDAFQQWKFKDYYAFRQAMTHIRVKGELTNVLYSMGYGDVLFKPHQYKPVLKFITENRGRLLIADEVGLGKTVEALYIWKELQAREGARRLLVVCPSSLTDKWQMDMERLFSMTPKSVKAKEFLEECNALEKDPMRYCCLVTSIEGIRSKERLDNKRAKTTKDMIFSLLEENKSNYSDTNHLFDLVIVDEAHNVRNSSTCNYKTVEALVGNSRNSVFLSATPIQTSSTNLFNLLRILAPEEFSNLDEFNRILSDNEHLVSLAGIFNKRYNPNILSAEIKAAEQELAALKSSRYFSNSGIDRIQPQLRELLSDDESRVRTFNFVTNKFFYSPIVSRTRKKDIPGENVERSSQTADFSLSDFEYQTYQKVTEGLRNTIKDGISRIHEFVITMKQREMASSLPAALEKWSHSYRNEDEESELYEELFGEGDDFSGNIDSGQYFSSPISTSEIEYLKEHDSKYYKFLNDVVRNKLSSNPDEKIIVFSFFKATLAYLESRLIHDGIRVLRMDGSVKDRTELIKKFRDENYSVLLSSEVGSEGIDLQFASVEVNYDIPWNPMRLEQRIGRIDRIGQKSKFVFIVNMVCRNTVEDRILLRLYERIQIFEKSIGETDEILGKLTTEIQDILLQPELSDEQRLALADQAITAEIKNRQLQEDLEEKAGITEAYGESIMNYIAETSNNNRFIRREDLINYVEDFFRERGSGSTITSFLGQRVNDPEEFRKIKLSDDAYNDYHSFSLKNHFSPTVRFHAGLVCCFPQGKTHAGFEGIDINHSLIRWIFSRNDEKFYQNGSNCFALTISQAMLPDNEFEKGTYVFFIKEIKFEGIRIRRELFHVVQKVKKDGMPLSLVLGEYLISQAIFHGNPMTDLNAYSKHSLALNSILDSCVRHADSLTEKSVNEFQEDDESTYNIQMNRIEKVHSSQVQSIQEIIDNYDHSDKYFNSVKRMQEGRIEKLNKEYNHAKTVLEVKRSALSLESEPLAAGIIRVE